SENRVAAGGRGGCREAHFLFCARRDFDTFEQLLRTRRDGNTAINIGERGGQKHVAIARPAFTRQRGDGEHLFLRRFGSVGVGNADHNRQLQTGGGSTCDAETLPRNRRFKPVAAGGSLRGHEYSFGGSSA